jgi:hypothetical protein
MALLPEPPSNVHMPVEPKEAKHVLATGTWTDEAALKIVLQDTNRAENFESTKSWVMGWVQASTLYQSPWTSRFWEGTQSERANVPLFTVATHVNSLTPQIMKGLFYDEPPFMIQNRPGTKISAARAAGAILDYQLEDADFRENLRLGVMNALLFGTTIWKWGWQEYTRERVTYRRKTSGLKIPDGITGEETVIENNDDDNIEEEVVEEEISRPFFDHIVNLRHVLVDPGLSVPDITKARYVVHRMYMTFDELDKLRERPGIKLPSKEELLMLFFPPTEEAKPAIAEISIRNPLWDARAEPRYENTSDDPFAKPLEVLERWDAERVIMVLQQKLVILNEKNPYGKIPFFSVGWWDVPEAFWGMGLGKAQPLDAKILTPLGWKQMGDIKPDDLVMGSDGKPHKVLEVFPQGEKEVFKVTFSDGATTECCKEHLWQIESALSKRPLRRGWKTKVFQLQDFKDALKTKTGANKYFIPITEPIAFSKQELPIHPYLLGILIGDGNLTTDTPRFSSADAEIVEAVQKLLPKGMQIVGVPNRRYDYKITSVDHRCNTVLRIVKELGLNCKAEHKFIPDIYKFSSIEQRKEILAGLLDSDGTAGKNGAASFSSSSEQLCDDVQFLVESLGGIAKKFIKPIPARGNFPAYSLSIGLVFNPFKLTRKIERYKPRTKYMPSRGFSAVEAVGTKPCQCILVDTPDHLYLTDHCIVTHNTVGSDQRLQQGVTNTWLDQLALNLNGVYTRVRGKSVPTQSIRVSPGKIIDVDSKDDLNPLQRSNPVPEALQALELSERRAESVSGANEFSTQGVAGASGHSNLARTASGANLLAAGSGSRIEDFVDKLANQVILPFLYEAHDLNCKLLSLSSVKHILSDELEHEFITEKQGDILDIVNSRVKFSILAGAKLSSRRTMTQGLPMLIQFLQAQPIVSALAIEKKKVSVEELIRMFFEIADWKNYNDVIVEMTPEDEQRWKASQPGAAVQQQLAAKAQLQQQSFEQKQQLTDQENIARAAREVLRQGFEKASEPLMVGGEPGGKALGSE